MGECKYRQRKSCIDQIGCKHFKQGYGRLQLGDVYTCHEFLQRSREFIETDSKKIIHELTQQFVDTRFGNPWQLAINKIHETSNIIICNSK